MKYNKALLATQKETTLENNRVVSRLDSKCESSRKS